MKPKPHRAPRLAVILAVAAPCACAEITYTLQFDPASSAQAQQVANSVATAAALYNQYGSFNKHWDVYHDPGIPTAQANYTGYMGYGGQRTVRVVLHEGGHTLGMGTAPGYATLIAGGVWGGAYGNQTQLDTYNDFGDGLHGDGHAIWPGGMNFEPEDGFIERIWHIRIMAAMRADMGIMAYTKEARNELVHPGETAVFRVESPEGATYQWFRNGVPLTNDGDISGATTPVLRIANSDAADEGDYHCASTGAGEVLNSRPRQLRVEPRTQLGQWNMDGNVLDSAGTHHATAFGAPAYVSGEIGQAIELDGSDDYIDLPDDVGGAKDITVATWVNWDGGGDWQRIFDFGTGTFQYMFLTPRAGGAGLRLAFKDSINGVDAEYRIDAPVLPTGSWVHLSVVLTEGKATLYLNGKPMGSAFGIPTLLTDFSPTNNHIGKSQFPDPLFNGRIDEFRIYNHALTGAEIWDLWGQSPNNPPSFDSPLVVPAARTLEAYTGPGLGSHASDIDTDELIFTKLHGPAWLEVAADGTLSGTPGAMDTGVNTFFVRVEDPYGASSDTKVQIHVTGTVAHWNFEEGTADAYVSYSQPAAGQFDGSMPDVSGNGNHLSAWTNNWHLYRAEVPGPNTPQLATTNTLSVQNAGNFPAISAIGTRLSSWSPSAWTIEAAIRPDSATNGFQTFLGRDSLGSHSASPALAALYFSIVPDGGLRINFTDAAGNNWDITTPANTIQSAKWHAVAATSDGGTLSLYLKNLTNGDLNYVLLGTLDISSSAASVLSSGTGDGNDWDSGVFTVARGLYNGVHADRFRGHLDDIRLSEGALAPELFLHSDAQTIPSPPPIPSPTSISTSQIDLSWTASTAATGYNVKRSTTSNGPYTTVGSPTDASFSDTALDPSTTYFYVVSAVNAAGQSPDSPEVNASTWTLAEGWRFTHFGIITNTGDAADDADPDGDGLKNLLERAIAGNPKAFEADKQLRSDNSAAPLSILYDRSKTATDLTLSILESSSLAPGSWVPASGGAVLLGEDSEVWHFRFTRDAGEDPKLYLRLRVTGP